MPRKLLSRAKGLFGGRSSANSTTGAAAAIDGGEASPNDGAGCTDDSPAVATGFITTFRRDGGNDNTPNGGIIIATDEPITITCARGLENHPLPLPASITEIPRIPWASVPVRPTHSVRPAPECSCDRPSSTRSKLASIMTSCLSMRRSRSATTQITNCSACARHPHRAENTEQDGNVTGFSLTPMHRLNELQGLSENQSQLLREIAMKEGTEAEIPPMSLEQAPSSNEQIRRLSMHWVNDTSGAVPFVNETGAPQSSQPNENNAPGAGMPLQNLSKPLIHTQIDYIHCLVPDIHKICQCSFYWGVMDRYQAEEQLENKPEGTFLLRDSAQEDFLFSVSFRRYGRSLHARIEQWNHRFSFDAHDPNVYSSLTVHGLIEHYKDPSCCMFFEPMLLHPLPRPSAFSLQQLCRATICDSTCYDNIDQLNLPNCLKGYLKFYHYKQKVRVRKMENGGYVHVNV